MVPMPRHWRRRGLWKALWLGNKTRNKPVAPIMGPGYIASNEDYCSPDIARVHPEPFRQEGPAGGKSGAGGMVRRSEQGFVEEHRGSQASLCHGEYRQRGAD